MTRRDLCARFIGLLTVPFAALHPPPVYGRLEVFNMPKNQIEIYEMSPRGHLRLLSVRRVDGKVGHS